MTKMSRDDIFIQHIQSHLTPGQEVICKICGKTAKEITALSQPRATISRDKLLTKEDIIMLVCSDCSSVGSCSHPERCENASGFMANAIYQAQLDKIEGK